MRHSSRTLVAAVACLAIVVGACSAQPVSEVGTAPEIPQPSAEIGTLAGSSPDASAGSASEAPPASVTPSAATATVPPARPAGTTYAIVSEQAAAGGGTHETHRVTWNPQSDATSFLVYGLKDCLRASKKNNGTPCVQKGMKIPRASLVQLGQAAGTDQSIDVSWVVPKSGREPYAAILLRAVNDAGQSIFAIVHSEDVCVGC
jgi:hypothetical protein